jgi:replicative DNA helicase
MNDRPDHDGFSRNVVRFPPGSYDESRFAPPSGAPGGMDAAGAAPPRALDAERALLGAILLDARAFDDVEHRLTDEDFSEEVHRHIFGVIRDRRAAGDAIDFTLMKTVLGDADLGGITVGAYLVQLMNAVTATTSAVEYAKLIQQAAQMRRVLETAQAAVAAMTSATVHSPASFASAMIEALDEVASAGLSESVRRTTLAQSAQKVMRRVERVRAGEERPGARYGIPSLDRATLGMRPGELIVVAGRPGMGKTTGALHFALSASVANGAVGFFSLEMNDVELAERQLAALAYQPRAQEEISYRAIAEGRNLSDAALRRLYDAEYACRKVPLWIEQQAGLTVSQIVTRSRQMKLRAERAGMPLAAIMVDHIGLVRPSRRYAGNRVQEISEITGALKGLAKDLDVPVLGLSQLNREVEKREDKRPQLSDLRDSGSIEQDADVVLGLFREAYYLERLVEPSDEDVRRLQQRRDVLEIEILKQRSGPTLRIDCFCNIACNVLAEMAP